MDFIPRFSVIQKIVNRAFYPSDRSITIFTEDKPSDRTLYEIILKRLIANEITVNKIIPLGPKNIVIEQSIRAKSVKNPSLFIVDSDIKVMRGVNLEDTNLISLDRYCIENYLCCEIGIIEYLYVKLGQDKDKLKHVIDFENQILKNFSIILKLYIRYLIVQEMIIGHTFKNYSELVSNDGYSISRQKVNSEIYEVEKKIKSDLKSKGTRDYKKELERRILEISTNIRYDSNCIISLISGKDHLLPFLRKVIFNLDQSSRGLNNDQLKRLLAEKFDIESLTFLRQKMISIAR